MPRHFQADVHQIAPTLATKPNFAADLTRPADGAVRLRCASPDFVNQIRPTLATLPNLSSDLARPPQNAVVLRNAASEFAAPPKFALVTAVASFIPGWFSTDGKPQIVFNYSRPESSVGQVRPTLATLPALLGGIAEISTRAVQLRHASPDIVRQENPTLATLPTLLDRIADWSNHRIEFVYAKSDYVAQTAPTLALLPRLTGLAEDSRRSNPPSFASAPSWSGPDKFGITVAASTFLPGWTSTDGKPQITLNYARPETWSSQVRPTLATLPTLLAGLADESRRANPPLFASSPSWSSPDKFGITVAAAVTLSNWLPNVAAPTVKPIASRAITAAPEKTIVASAVPSLGWLSQTAAAAVRARYRGAHFAAPDKTPLIVGIVGTICAQAAAVRLAMEAQSAQVRFGMEATAAQVRLAMEAQAAQVRFANEAAMQAQSAAVRLAMEALSAKVVCC